MKWCCCHSISFASRIFGNTPCWFYAVKVPKSVWRMWQKLPFMRRKMGHINCDDLRNSMPHVISVFPKHVQGDEFDLCLLKHCSWGYTSVYKRQTPAWYKTVTSQSTCRLDIAVPSFMTCSAALDLYTWSVEGNQIHV